MTNIKSMQNHNSLKKHKWQRIWQILVPFLVFCMAGLAVGVLLVIGASRGNASLGHWANFSMILVVLPVMGMALADLLFLCVLIYVVAVILNKVPQASLSVQQIFLQAQHRIALGADGSLKPIMRIHETVAIVTKLYKRLFRKSK